MIIFPIAFISGLTLLLKALSSAPEIVATVDADEASDPTPALALRASNEMVPPPKDSDVPRPTFLSAQRMQGEADREFVAEGEAELGGDHHLVAKRRDGFAENPLALMRAVGFGGVEKGDSALKGRADDVDHFGPGGNSGLVGPVHVLHAEADTGDFQLTELSPRADLRRGGQTSGIRRPGLSLRLRTAAKPGADNGCAGCDRH